MFMYFPIQIPLKQVVEMGMGQQNGCQFLGTRQKTQLRAEAGWVCQAELGPQELLPERLAHWIGLRENFQETMVFTIKYRAFL